MHIVMRRPIALVAALLVAACSQSPTGPSAVNATAVKGEAAGADGSVQGSLAGDVLVGGAIEMNLVRVAQDGTGGVPAFYAFPGGAYTVRPNIPVEIYAQIWTATNGVTNPRFVVDWGNGDRENTSCGSCRLSHTYPRVGSYTVRVILDDRISSTTTRTFTLNVGESGVRAGFGTFNGSLTESDPIFDRYSGSFAPPSSTPGCFTNEEKHYYKTYVIQHPGGPLDITIASASFDTYLNVYSGSFNPENSCANIVASDDDGGVGVFSKISASFPAGTYVIVVTSYDGQDTGTYTLVIQ